MSKANLHATLAHLWFYSYGQVGSRRQGETIRGLGEPRSAKRHPDAAEIARAVARELRNSAPMG